MAVVAADQSGADDGTWDEGDGWYQDDDGQWFQGAQDADGQWLGDVAVQNWEGETWYGEEEFDEGEGAPLVKEGILNVRMDHQSNVREMMKVRVYDQTNMAIWKIEAIEQNLGASELIPLIEIDNLEFNETTKEIKFGWLDCRFFELRCLSPKDLQDWRVALHKAIPYFSEAADELDQATPETEPSALEEGCRVEQPKLMHELSQLTVDSSTTLPPQMKYRLSHDPLMTPAPSFVQAKQSMGAQYSLGGQRNVDGQRRSAPHLRTISEQNGYPTEDAPRSMASRLTVDAQDRSRLSRPSLGAQQSIHAQQSMGAQRSMASHVCTGDQESIGGQPSVGPQQSVGVQQSVGPQHSMGVQRSMGGRRSSGVRAATSMASRQSVPVSARSVRPRDLSQATKLVMITDLGQDNDDEMAIMLMSELVMTGEVEPLAVIANLKPSPNRAALARGTLDMLGLSHVPVGIGTDGGQTKHKDTFSGYVSQSQTGVDYLKDPMYNAQRVVEAIGTNREAAVSFEHRIWQGQTLMRRVLREAEDGSVTFLLISSFKDIAQFLSSNEELFQAKVRAVVAMSGVDQESCEAAIAGMGTPLLPDPQTHNHCFDLEAASFTFKRLQELGIPMTIVTRFAAYGCPVPRHVYDLMIRNLVPNPVACRLSRAQQASIDRLWRDVCAGDKLPARCDRAWFCNTFCGGEGLDRAAEAPVWDLVKHFHMYDPMALLAAIPSKRELFFESAEVIGAHGTLHRIIGAVPGNGVRSDVAEDLRNALADAWIRSASRPVPANSLRASTGTSLSLSARPEELENENLTAALGPMVTHSPDDLRNIRDDVLDLLNKEWPSLKNSSLLPTWEKRDQLMSRIGPRMMLLDWQTVRDLGRIPHSAEKKTIDLHEASRRAKGSKLRFFIEMFSHRWISRCAPDDAQNSKARALVEWGKQRQAVDLYTFFWVDYACIDQNDIAPGVCMLPLYVSSCNNIVCYDTPDYESRAWCRIERLIFIAFVAPNNEFVTPDFRFDPSAKRRPNGDLIPEVEECACVCDPDDGFLSYAADAVMIRELNTLCATHWGKCWKDGLMAACKDSLKSLQSLDFGATQVRHRHFGGKSSAARELRRQSSSKTGDSRPKIKMRGDVPRQSRTSVSSNAAFFGGAAPSVPPEPSKPVLAEAPVGADRLGTATKTKGMPPGRMQVRPRPSLLRPPSAAQMPARVEHALRSGDLTELRQVYGWACTGDFAIESRLLEKVRNKIRIAMSARIRSHIRRSEVHPLYEILEEVARDPLLEVILSKEMLEEGKALVARELGHSWQVDGPNLRQFDGADVTHREEIDIDDDLCNRCNSPRPRSPSPMGEGRFGSRQNLPRPSEVGIYDDDPLPEEDEVALGRNLYAVEEVEGEEVGWDEADHAARAAAEAPAGVYSNDGSSLGGDEPDAAQSRYMVAGMADQDTVKALAELLIAQENFNGSFSGLTEMLRLAAGKIRQETNQVDASASSMARSLEQMLVHAGGFNRAVRGTTPAQEQLAAERWVAGVLNGRLSLQGPRGGWGEEVQPEPDLEPSADFGATALRHNLRQGRDSILRERLAVERWVREALGQLHSGLPRRAAQMDTWTNLEERLVDEALLRLEELRHSPSGLASLPSTASSFPATAHTGRSVHSAAATARSAASGRCAAASQVRASAGSAAPSRAASDVTLRSAEPAGRPATAGSPDFGGRDGEAAGAGACSSSTDLGASRESDAVARWLQEALVT